MAPSIAGFLFLLALRGKRKKLHVGNFKMQFFSSGVMEQCMIIRIFIVAIPTVMFTPRAHVFAWQRIDKHDKHAYGIQCSWKTGRNLHFNLPFLHGLNLRCNLLAGQPWHRSTCLGSEQIEVRGPHIEILPSGREAISQYPILPEVRDLRNHTHSN